MSKSAKERFNEALKEAAASKAALASARSELESAEAWVDSAKRTLAQHVDITEQRRRSVAALSSEHDAAIAGLMEMIVDLISEEASR